MVDDIIIEQQNPEYCGTINKSFITNFVVMRKGFLLLAVNMAAVGTLALAGLAVSTAHAQEFFGFFGAGPSCPPGECPLPPDVPDEPTCPPLPPELCKRPPLPPRLPEPPACPPICRPEPEPPF